MIRYSVEPRKIKYVKRVEFRLFAGNLSNKYGKKLQETATKAGIDAPKTASKKLSIKQLKQKLNL